MPHPPPLRFLVAESEPPQARDARRRSVGRSSGETYADLLTCLAPGSQSQRVGLGEAQMRRADVHDLDRYDAVFLAGSPLHLYQETAETRCVVAFMRAVFAAGAPAFGSCAGLQIATVAGGGTVRAMPDRHEAAFARRITPTAAGAAHPLLAGRPQAYDALAIHSDEVETLPKGATLLACNRVTAVQAAEIRCGEGVFWGVQYHPEISLHEVAAAVRRDGDELVADGFAKDRQALDAQADLIDALHEAPQRRDLAWRLGVDEQVTEPKLRTCEIANFIERLVKPTRSKRGRS